MSPHCETCTCGCTCGYGGQHEDLNPRCALNHRGPQDEEAAQVCGAHGCSNRATGMRKSHVPGWADVPDCGMHTQRSGTARPEAAEVCCYDGLRPCEYPQCARVPQRSAGGTARAEGSET